MPDPIKMPKPNSAQAQEMPLDTLNFQATPVQIGNEIRVLIGISDVIGISTQFLLNQQSANALWHCIREGCNAAETTLVKPQSSILPS